jgi:hypothetical protein
MGVLLLALSGALSGPFTEATQRDLLRRCTHWPSAAEVYDVLCRTISPAMTTAREAPSKTNERDISVLRCRRFTGKLDRSRGSRETATPYIWFTSQ